MKSLFVVLALLVAPLSQAHAGLFFEGTFQGKTGSTTFYGDQTVNYENCQVDFKVSVKPADQGTQLVKVEKLRTQCSSPTYWIFDQIMSTTEFVIDSNGKVAHEGLTVGTLNDKGLSVSFDDGGQKFFLDLHPTAKGMELDWSSRSFDDVNFDVKSELSPL